MKKLLLFLLFISSFANSDIELWSSEGDKTIKFYLDLDVITNEPDKAIQLIKEMVVFVKRTEKNTKFYEYYISEDKKKISLTEHYKNDAAALKHVLDFQNGPYQETFFELMSIKSFQVMGPASRELVNSLKGLTDDFREKVDGFKRIY